MRRSDSIVALVKALAEAQAEMDAPKKSKTANITSERTGKTHSYSYADLAAVRDAYKGPLSKRGLVVSHALEPVDGHVVLATTLMHVSGEWIASDYPIPSYDKPQEQGSALTYFKRYNVCALLDIVAEDDDDGATAQAAKPKETQEPVSAEDAAILLLAGELADLTEMSAEAHIKVASQFTNPKGELVQGFTDPRKIKPGRWKSMTKANLEKRLYEAKLKAEPGVEEAAELFK